MKTTEKAPVKHKDLLVFPAGAPIQLPAGLPAMPMNVFSEFGFKLTAIKETGCTDVQVWTPATEDDYRQMLARLLNVPPKDVVIEQDAKFGPPKKCGMFNGVCRGTCASTKFCKGVYDIKLGLIGCACK